MKKLFFTLLTALSVQVFAQSPTVSVPFEIYGDHLFIQLSVDGSEPLDFIFDTGDGLTVLDLDVAKSLSLNLDHKQQTSSAQGTITGALIKHNKVDIGGMIMESNVKIYATSLSHLEISIGRNVDGIIGYDLIHHHAIGLDYGSMTFNVYDAASFPKNGTALPIKMVSGIPTIEAAVTLNSGETVSGSYFVNTGAGTTLDFNSPFANSNGIIDKTGEHYSYVVKGLGNAETLHYEGRVKSLSFGGNEMINMPIGISQSASGLQGDKKIAGIIGNRLLMKFNMMIDVKGGNLYLEKNEQFAKPIAVNCSGIDVQMNADQSSILIHKVFEGSDAAEAGLMVDDLLVSINGKSAKDLGLMKVEKILKTAGTTVKLVVMRKGVEQSVSLSLKELI